jgi:hypothetical protein
MLWVACQVRRNILLLACKDTSERREARGRDEQADRDGEVKSGTRGCLSVVDHVSPVRYVKHSGLWGSRII